MKLVKYSAEWCGPCKQYAPVAHRVSKDMGIPLVEIDIDENPEEGISSVPTTRLLGPSGKILAEKSGAMTPGDLKRWIQDNAN